MKDLMQEVEQILAGIDKTESESADGWWETSAGSAFGAERLKLVMAAINRIADNAAIQSEDKNQ